MTGRLKLIISADPANQGSWTWNHLLEDEVQSLVATSATFSAHGGSFAIGYSNGTITMHPTASFHPDLVDNTADGSIRDMLALPDGVLIAVTNRGMVQRMPFCDSCISNAALARVAKNRLELDERLGLVVMKHVPANNLPFGPAN
jgi:hypothetical protein